MRRYLWVLGLLTASAALAADLPLKPFTYTEGFEGAPPAVALWASRGSDPVVTTLAPSTERAFEGTHSLKMDITFGDGTYYYFGLPLRVPCEGKLRLSARLWVAPENQNTVGFGANLIFPPTTHSGCSSVESFNKPSKDWELIEADLVQYGREMATSVIPRNVAGLTGKDVGVFVDRWALFLTGQPGKRVVAYLDDIRIEGEVPEEQAYLQQSQVAFDASRAAFKTQVEQWAVQLARAQKTAADAGRYAADAPRLVEVIQKCSSRAEELLGEIRKAGYSAPWEVAELASNLTALENWPRALESLKAAKAAGRKFVASPCNRPTMAFRKGDSGMLALATGDALLSASACPGEYESVSVTACALQDTAALTVSCSPLKSRAGTLPETAVDIRLLKSWFQGASTGIGYTKNKWLIPELLLKDDKLVKVDLAAQDNYLRHTAADGTHSYVKCSDPDSTALEGVQPVDARTLQPIDIAAGESQEYWITIHVPESAAAGLYEGTVTLASAAGTARVPVRLTVHPFALQPSRLVYSIYYRARLSEDGQPRIDSELRSEEQYRAEIADMKAHGVLYPTNYQGRGPRLQRAMEIRRECGLPTDRFYNLGYSVGPQTEAQLPALREEIKWWISFLKPFGYRDVYFYGIDEATGEMLARQKAAWAATQEAGGKTFVACYYKTFEAMGKLLNTAVLAGVPDPAEAQKYHSVGSEAFCYANPQVGVEDPAVYRRNFGLLLWKAGFDGAMDYAYQHGFNHVWNDFDEKTYRDHNFTYPTVDGIVGTIAWEGFREAVDDVRYVTTLERAITKAPAARKADAAAAKRWLDSLDPATADLDATRAAMAGWIRKLL